MVQIGLCSVTFRDKQPEEILQLMAGSTPLEVIEWAGDSHVKPEDTEDQKAQIAQQSKQAGIETSSYGSYYHAGEGEDFTQVLATALTLKTNDIRIWAGEIDLDKDYGDINKDKQNRIIEDIKAVAQLATEHNINVHIEHHKWTYTDTAQDAVYLLEEINEPNVYLCWQPPMDNSVSESVKDIHLLGNWISNVHVFHWNSNFDRFPLREGQEAWQQYINALEEYPFANRNYLLEFVKDDNSNQMKQDAEVLNELIRSI